MMASLKASSSAFIIFTCLLFPLSVVANTNQTDRDALLEFRRGIPDDPDSVLTSWNDTVNFCHWPGITCSRRRPRVTELVLPDSRLGGSMSPYIGNLSFLRIINIANNGFAGEIPPEIGNLHRLIALGLDNNSFSGLLPENISGCTNLGVIFLGNNKLVGEIPRGLSTLSKLRVFQVHNNHFTGKFPHYLSNFSSLEFIDGRNNGFSGPIPASLGRLRRLQWIFLGANSFSGMVPTSISNLTSLTGIGFSFNKIGGTLPPSIWNLSSNLISLAFSFNQFMGTIPPSIGNFHNLEYLRIGWNQFIGMLPKEIGNLHKLKILQAGYNNYSGEIPSSLGNLSMLTMLSLAGNGFSGSIPASFEKCQNLISLDLSENNLSGNIPSQVLGIASLSNFLDLSQNKLTGALPDEVGNLKNLTMLDMHGNRLSDEVPNTLGGCTSLVLLHIGNNLFEGNISAFLSPLKGLQQLDLSQNNFSGQIPEFLGDFPLTDLNLSFNHFEGELPNKGVFLNATGISVIGNYKICGGISALNLPRCSPFTPKSGRKKMLSEIIIMITSGIAVLFVLLLLLASHRCINRKRTRNVESHCELVPKSPFPQISYMDILGATDGLNQNNLIGAGGFGSVYKGILGNSNNVVAIKVLDLRTQAASKSFIAECEVLKKIRHRNLVKIITVCSTIDFRGNDFKALVYEYMENGSLEDWLHPKVRSEGVNPKLSLTHRMSIAVDIVCAMEYLHHECGTPVIHCDLKPGNVLLDVEMTAHIGDFGLTRILSAEDVVLQVSSSGVRGTVGYCPPEYGMGCQVSREGDVYSYGILLLEMFTGKRPTDDMFQDAWNIRTHCEAALPERVGEIADPCLFLNEFGEGSSARAPRRIQECLAKVFEIGVACCCESPGQRMDIRVATAKLRSIKSLVG